VGMQCTSIGLLRFSSSCGCAVKRFSSRLAVQRVLEGPDVHAARVNYDHGSMDHTHRPSEGDLFKDG